MKRTFFIESRGRQKLASVSLLVALTWPQSGWSDVPTTTDPLTERFKFVNTLIEESSGARELASGAPKQARDRREQARRLYREAAAARDAGNRERAAQLLAEATTKMFEAVRLADSHQGTAKAERDFNSRLESVNALLEAYSRVCNEKACDAKTAEQLRDDVRGKVANARGRLASDPVGARRLLDSAYEDAKIAIQRLRGGDTLVRSLEFSSKEDEYRYELDRNDTHRMLINVLMGEKLADPNVAKSVRSFLDAAAELRRHAETEAGQGHFEQAIGILESSTRELQRALRGAGIFIPGSG